MKKIIVVLALLVAQSTSVGNWCELARQCEDAGVPFLWLVTFKDVTSISQCCDNYCVFSANINTSFILMADSTSKWSHKEGGRTAGWLWTDREPLKWDEGNGLDVTIRKDGDYMYISCGNEDYWFSFFSSRIESPPISFSTFNVNPSMPTNNPEGCQWYVSWRPPVYTGVGGTVNCIAFSRYDLPADFDPNTITIEQLLGIRTFKKYAEKFSDGADINCLSHFVNGWLNSPEDFDCNDIDE